MEIVGSNVTEQTDRVKQNLQAVLKASGTDLGRVVKTTVYLSDMALFAEMNTEYQRHLGDHKPARTTVAVRELPKSVMVEIDCIAMVD